MYFSFITKLSPDKKVLRPYKIIIMATAVAIQTTPLHKKQHMFVGEEEFKRIMASKYQTSVPCSEQEIQEMEEILEVSSLKAEEYVVGFDRSCDK